MFIPPPLARALAIAELAAAAPIMAALLFLSAPYGRFARSGWGPVLPASWGWFLMELPSLAVPPILFISGRAWGSTWAWAALAVWEAHYIQRDLIYPFLLRSSRPMPLAVLGMGFAFNLLNAYLNAWWLFRPGAAGLAGTSAFITGVAVFVAGYGINLDSDRVLRELRRGGRMGYAIPQRGLHRLVASPNYLGECIEWMGWALLAGNPAGWAFAAFTLANLLPRALKNLQWYRREFGQAYPASRKAFIPFIL